MAWRRLGETDRGAGTETDAAWRCLAKPTAGLGRRLERRGADWQNGRLGWDGGRCGVAGRGDEAMKLECGMEAGSPMGLDVKRCGVGLRPTI